MVVKLNPRKINNYAFYCPVSRLHLTRYSNPVGSVNEVTPYIERGLKSGVLIEVKEEAEVQKRRKAAKEEAASEPVEEPVIEEPVEEQTEEAVVEEEPAEEAPVEEKVEKTEKKKNKKNKA